MKLPAVIEEAGYESAMLGVSLSWASTPERAKEIAPNLAHKGGGHSKFLESMYLWLDVQFPRYVWQEADTYRVGTTKQSASTMHTLTKGILTGELFDGYINPEQLTYLNAVIKNYSEEKDAALKKELFLELKGNLPESFLQRRIWVFNYATLQNIYRQRYHHKLPHWKIFLDSIISQISHPEFIVKTKE